MKLTCGNCQQQVQVDESKIPTGSFKIKCPKCGKIITSQKELAGAAAEAAAANTFDATVAAPSGGMPEISPAVEAFVKREMANLRKEILGSMQSLFGGD